MPLFSVGDKIEQYTIQALIKSNTYTETYRVVDTDETPFFLKVFNSITVPAKLHDKESKTIREIKYVSQLHHDGLAQCVAHGQLDEPQCHYYVTNFLNGTLLQQHIEQNGPLSEETALEIFKSLLKTLQYLHETQNKLCHNDIDPSNIMLPQATDLKPVLIDLGHLYPASYTKPAFMLSDLNPFYHSNNNASGCFIENDDLFSAVAVLYFMLSGHAPWHKAKIDTSLDFNKQLIALKKYRSANAIGLDNINISKKIKTFIDKTIGSGVFKYFHNVGEVLEWLSDYTTDTREDKEHRRTRPEPKENVQGQEKDFSSYMKKGNGNGFKDIAGMESLKKELNEKVLFILKNKELAQQYKLTPPNGMLLYGPPGCGKTYISEKFAEESGCNYIYIKSSDLSSVYIHGSQLIISDLFKFAAKHAPIVICFDELDAMVPDRSSYSGEHQSNEVNEFLTQMNNCSQRGIFLIGSTNRPDKIDPAILRTGRLDKQIYVPLPDSEARNELFHIHLNGRPLDSDIDYQALSKATEGYIASDIAYIVNDAATVAAYARKKIDQQTILNTISYTNSSISKDAIKLYDTIREKIEDRQNQTNRRIGFHRE